MKWMKAALINYLSDGLSTSYIVVKAFCGVVNLLVVLKLNASITVD